MPPTSGSTPAKMNRLALVSSTLRNAQKHAMPVIP